MSSSPAVQRDLVFALGRSTGRLFARLERICTDGLRRPELRRLRAEYPSAHRDASRADRDHNLAWTDDYRGLFRWCRTEGCQGDATTGRWCDLAASSPVGPDQSTWLYRYKQAHGLLEGFWNSMPDRCAALHVVVGLGDGAGGLLPAVLDELGRRFQGRMETNWVHVHAVLPQRAEPRFSARRWAAANARRVLLRVRDRRLSNSDWNVAWWLLGHPMSEPDELMDEACRLLARLVTGPSPDPVSRWYDEQLRSDQPHRPPITWLGTYRCPGGASSSADEPAPAVLGFPESHVPVHRQDVLPRLMVGWNTPSQWPCQVQLYDPRWQGDDLPGHPLAGWALCYLWLCLEWEDLGWWSQTLKAPQSSPRSIPPGNG